MSFFREKVWINKYTYYPSRDQQSEVGVYHAVGFDNWKAKTPPKIMWVCLRIALKDSEKKACWLNTYDTGIYVETNSQKLESEVPCSSS